MDEHSLIREILHFVHRHRNATMVIKIDRVVAGRIDEVGLTRDIHILHRIGICLHVFIDASDPNLHVVTIPDLGEHHLQNSDPPLQTDPLPGLHCSVHASRIPDELPADCAIALRADKLIYVTSADGIHDGETLINELTLEDANRLLRERPNAVTFGVRAKLEQAIRACAHGVPRVHIVSGLRPDTLLTELFTSRGCGTMVHHSPYHTIREARLDEVPEIVELLNQAHVPAVVYQHIASSVECCYVYCIDNSIHGCVIVRIEQPLARVEYLAANRPEELQKLLQYAERLAADAQCEHICLYGTTVPPWLPLHPWFTTEFHIAQKTHPSFHPSIPRGKVWMRSIASGT